MLNFKKIIGNQEQIDILYELLKKREHNISHKIIPSIKQHAKFVINHPYRAWYLIKSNEQYLGSVYIQKNNCVGISILINQKRVLSESLDFIFKKYKPLKEIKSIRPPYFYINVPPSNKKLISHLKYFGGIKVQVTYSFNSLKLKRMIKK